MSRGAAALPPETPRIELQPLPAAPGHSCFRSWTVHPKWGTGEGGPALGAVLLPKESVRATGGVSPGGFGGVGGGGWAQRSGPPTPPTPASSTAQARVSGTTLPTLPHPGCGTGSPGHPSWAWPGPGQRGRRGWRSEAAEAFLYSRNCMEMMVSSSRTPKLPTSQGRWCRR